MAIAGERLSTTVVGHRQVLSQLDRAIATGRPSHAYLIYGPAQVGKSRVATWLAQRLCCEGSTPPCGTCRACRLIAQAKYADVRELRVESDPAALGLQIEGPPRPGRAVERSISIEKVRALQRDAALTPVEGRRKVYVISSAERLTIEAANALLKTLEEPPAPVILILLATEPRDLLPTIVSRCLQVRLGLVAPAQIAAGLVSAVGISREQADLFARLSGGRPGWAIAAATDPSVMAERGEELALLQQLLAPSLRDRFSAAERLANQNGKAPARTLALLDRWRVWCWDALLYCSGLDQLVANVDQEHELRALGERVGRERIFAFVGAIGTTADYLRQNVNARLALEALALQAPGLA